MAELTDLKVGVHGDTAIVTGAYHDRLTDVWMKVGGKWQVVA